MAYAQQSHVNRLEEALAAFAHDVGEAQLRTEQELRDFKDEMTDFKEEMRHDRREMNRKWGELARKMGTMVEDLVAPSLPRIVQETTGLEVTDLMVRRKRKLPDGRVFEYDAIAMAGDVVFLNSTKSTLRPADIGDFVEEIGRFRTVFPEYGKYPLIGVLASLSVDDSVLSQAEKAGFIVLAVGDQVMEVKNRSGFQPKRWGQ